jgi:ferredoxin
MSVSVSADKCTGCESCVESCPLGAIEMKDDVAVINPETCGECGACVDVCPSQAISMD